MFFKKERPLRFNKSLDGDRKNLGSIGEIADHICDSLIPKNPKGFTFDPRLRSVPEFNGIVFLVSAWGYEADFQIPPEKQQVSKWLALAESSLAIDGTYIGGWARADERFCLDVTVPTEGLALALLMGSANRQTHMFHPLTETEIEIEEAINHLANGELDWRF